MKQLDSATEKTKAADGDIQRLLLFAA